MPSSRWSSQPGLEPRSPTLQVDSLPTEPPGNDQIHFTPNIALVGLLIFQGYVSVNTGLSHSSHFCGRLDLVQKRHGTHTKASLSYSEAEQKRNIYSDRRFYHMSSEHRTCQSDERFFPHLKYYKIYYKVNHFPKDCCMWRMEKKKKTQNKVRIKD